MFEAPRKRIWAVLTLTVMSLPLSQPPALAVDRNGELQQAIKDGDSDGEYRARIELSAEWRDRGDFKQSVDHLVRAMQLAEHQSNSIHVVQARSMLGSVFAMMREPRHAAAAMLPAIETVLASDDALATANVLNDLALLMATLDRPTKSFTLGEFESLIGGSAKIQYPTWTGDQWNHVDLLGPKNLAKAKLLWNVFEKSDDSRAVLTKALNLTDLAKSPAHAARIAINLSRANAAQGDKKKAKLFVERGVEYLTQLEPNNEKVILLLALNRIAIQVRDRTTESPDAVAKRANVALALAQELKTNRLVSQAYGQLSELYQSEKRFDEALALTRQAIFAAQQVGAKDLLFRLQWRTGRLLRQMGKLDTAIKAYALAIKTLESPDLRSDLATGFGNQVGSASFREHVGELFYEQADLIFQQARSQKDVLTSGQLQGQLLQARQTVEQLKSAELSNYFQSDCVAQVRSKSKNIDRVVSDSTAIVYLVPLKDRLEILVSLENGHIEWASVDVDAKTLRATVTEFRQSLTDLIRESYDEPAQKLYGWIIEPIAKKLRDHHIKTLVFVPDGALRTVPMAALMNGEKHLIEEFAVAITPGLSLTDPQRIERRSVNILLSGLSEGIDGFAPLPNVPTELKRIGDLFGTRSTQLLNKQFVVNNVDQAVRKQPYGIVHIASHGKFSSNLDDTYILTHEGYDRRMTLDKLEGFIRPAQFRFDKQPIELLTLSACETAAGDDRAALGLAGIAIKAGARSAVASLWPVQDQETSELMATFYEHLINHPEMSKAQALQAAQKHILENVEYHPYYWSAFLIIGNWQ